MHLDVDIISPSTYGKLFAGADNDSERETKEWKRSELEPSEDRVLVSVRDDMGVEGELVEAGDEVTWEVCSSAEEKARASNERAQRAEVAAGLAAAQVSFFIGNTVLVVILGDRR